MLKSRTLAVIGSIGVLSLAAVPFAAAASSQPVTAAPAHVDASRDAKGVRHLERKADLAKLDLSRTDRSAGVRVS